MGPYSSLLPWKISEILLYMIVFIIFFIHATWANFSNLSSPETLFTATNIFNFFIQGVNFFGKQCIPLHMIIFIMLQPFFFVVPQFVLAAILEQCKELTTTQIKVLSVLLNTLITFLVIFIFAELVNLDKYIMMLASAIFALLAATVVKQQMSDYSAYFILRYENIIKPGVEISLENMRGKITKINPRFTTLICKGNKETYVPNSKLIGNIVSK